MTEFEHMMLVVCFSAAVGTTLGSAIGLVITFIGNRIEAHRAKKRRLKETSDK